VPAEDHRDYDYRAGNKREQHPAGAILSPVFSKIDAWEAFSAEQIVTRLVQWIAQIGKKRPRSLSRADRGLPAASR
jgi:hypothetical protein